jgi:hypothetical protein
MCEPVLQSRGEWVLQSRGDWGLYRAGVSRIFIEHAGVNGVSAELEW